MQLVNIVLQQFFCFLVSLVKELTDFLIDFCRNFFTVIFVTRNITSQKYLVLTVPEGNRAKFRAHAVFANHLACQRGCALQVVAGTAGNFLQHQSFGYAPAKQHFQFVKHFASRCVITVFFRQA